MDAYVKKTEDVINLYQEAAQKFKKMKVHEEGYGEEINRFKNTLLSASITLKERVQVEEENAQV